MVLKLRTLAGLNTAEIARALLVAESAMAQRLVRAQRKNRNAAIPYRVPPAHLLPERTAGVRAASPRSSTRGPGSKGPAELGLWRASVDRRPVPPRPGSRRGRRSTVPLRSVPALGRRHGMA